MVQIAPRVTYRLVELVERLDNGSRSIADICREAGDAAGRLGKPRPSYETVRVLVHRARSSRGPSTAEIVLDVALRARSPEAILDHVSGIGVPPL